MEERERRLAETQKMEAEKREQEALNKEKAAFISWITAYFAKGQKREGEYRANNFFRQQAHTFTLTMTRDPIVAVSGDKLRLEAFAKLHWHGKFRSYEDQDQIRIKAESLSLSDNPRGGWIDIVYIDPSGKEMVFERQNNGLIHDKAFVPNDFVLEPRTPER